MSLEPAEKPKQPEKLLVAGLITSGHFQKARFIANRLHQSFPAGFDEPVIRPMMNVDWEEYFTKMKRKYGDGVYALERKVMVFSNDTFVGDSEDLYNYISKKFRMTVKDDWYELGRCHLIDYLRDIMGKYRQLVYIMVSIKYRVIGTMLFELYNDLVPLTCENFLKRCKSETDGYTGTQIHRIVKNGWIQCGGFDLKEVDLPSENYIVSHDRRGVLGMCNSGPHKNNSTQFFITLAPSLWMDNRFVAFGQLLQGAEILEQIEQVPTYYESPTERIDIVKCGELTFNLTTDHEPDELQHFYPTDLLDDLLGPKSSFLSKLSASNYDQKCYLSTDLQHYLWPFMALPPVADLMYDTIAPLEGEGTPQTPISDHYTDLCEMAQDQFLKDFAANNPDLVPSGSDMTL